LIGGNLTKGPRDNVILFTAAAATVLLTTVLGAAETPRYPVYLLERAPVLDGEVDGDPAWDGIPAGTGFHVLGGRRPAEKQTSFRIGFTPDALYVGVVCEEPEIADVPAVARDGDGAIWKEDGVEVFIRPKDGPTVFQVISNTAGAHTDYCNSTDSGLHAMASEPFSRTAASKGARSYSIEIEMPFARLGRTPRDGEVWQGNVCRNTYVGGSKRDTFSTWARLVRLSLEPENFAQLVFHSSSPPGNQQDIPSHAPQGDDAELHLVVSLSFDEGYGEVAHGQSAMINDGKIVGAKWVPGKFGYALEFEEGDYVEVPHSESINGITSAVTLECWAYFDLDKLEGTNGTLISTTPRSGFRAGFRLNYKDMGNRSRSIEFAAAGGPSPNRTVCSADNAIKTSGWHHVLGCYDPKLTDGKRGKIYVDGQMVTSWDHEISGLAPSGLSLMIGSKPTSRAAMSEMIETFLGKIDEVKVWRTALTGEDIDRLYGSLWAKSAPLSPEPNAAAPGGKPRFEWSVPEDGTSNVFEIAQTPDFSSGVLVKEALSNAHYQVSEALSPGVYYWRVWSTDKAGKPTAACQPRALIVPWEDAFEQADTTPPKITDVKPALDAPADSATPVISARWSDDNGIDVASAQLLSDGKDVTAKAEVTAQGISFTPDADLAQGVHKIEIVVRDTSGNAANRVRQRFWLGEPPKMVVRIGEDRITYINDEPFFPIMYYGAGPSSEERARTGFNTKYSGAGYPSELTGSKRGEKQRAARVNAGIKHFAGMRTLYMKEGAEGVGKVIPFYDKRVEFLAYTMDEPSGAPGGLDWAKGFYGKIVELGHHRPALWLLNNSSAAGAFGKFADGIMIDCYPAPSRPLVQVAKYVDHCSELLDHKKPVWFCQQAFDWQVMAKYYHRFPEGQTKAEALQSLRESGYVFRPTPEETRCMTYLVLAHDAKGILWWSSSWGDRRLASIVDFPAEYAALCDLVGEVRHLSAMLLAPDAPVRIEVTPSGLPVHLKAKSYDGKIYVIAVNANEDVPVAPRFKLPAGSYTKVDVLFENRSVQLAGDSFRDLFDSIGVHVYRIE